jgi:aldose 1-epimerase
MKKTMLYSLAVLSVITFLSCGSGEPIDEEGAAIEKKDTLSLLAPKPNFEDTMNGKKVHLFYLKNKNIKVSITNYGGRVVNLIVPDSSGEMKDVAVGYDNFSDFSGSQNFFGATIGRYGNRIAKGKFALNGRTYELPVNNTPNSLHGGPGGFHNVVWDGIQMTDSSLQLTYKSKDGEMGFPGNLYAKVTFTATAETALKIEYEALTDKPTVCNLTNHTYFNLNGEGTINDHILMINANQYTPVDANLIPTGKLDSVGGTPFDFRTPYKIGEKINEKNTQLNYGHGYDHNFVLPVDSGKLVLAAEAIGDKSRIAMKVFTTEPGIQFYGGNFMQGKNDLKRDTKDKHRSAFCLETQHFPDSPNQPDFPSTTLNPGDTYKSTTVYKFNIAK